MQLNNAGIEETIRTVQYTIAQRMCCLETGMVIAGLSISQRPYDFDYLIPNPCPRCQAVSPFFTWAKSVWVKYAAKAWDYQAKFIRVPGLHDLPIQTMYEAGRYIVSHVSFEYASSYDDSREGRLLTVDIEAEDTDMSTAVQELETVPLFGVHIRYAGRRRTPRKLSVRLNLPWQQLGYAEKDGLVFIDSMGAARDLMDLLDWWLSNPASIPKQLSRLSVQQATAASEKWHEREAAKRAAELKRPLTDADQRYLGELTITHTLHVPNREGEPKIEHVDRKYQVTELLTPRALTAEGSDMRNCLGSYASELKHSRFASIRGKDRRDSYTVHFRTIIDGSASILQARGFANRGLEMSEESQIAAGLGVLTGSGKV